MCLLKIISKYQVPLIKDLVVQIHEHNDGPAFVVGVIYVSDPVF
jgi:hypothetical protein